MKKITILVFTIFLLMFINSCEDSSNKAGNLVDVEGYVTDDAGTPMPGVILKAFTNDEVLSVDTTDSQGLFSLFGVPESVQNLNISASLDGYGHWEMTYKMAATKMMKGKLPIVLSKDEDCCNIVKVIVKDAKSGEAIHNAEVKLATKNEFRIIKKTDSSGTVVFDSVCTGSYWIRVAYEGYKVVEEDFRIDSCSTKVFEVNLVSNHGENCCNVIKVKVFDKATNDVLKEAEVKLANNNGFVSKKYTDHYGYVVFTEVCDGSYWFRTYKNGYKVIEGDLSVSGCDTLSLENGLEKIAEDTCCNNKLVIYLYDKDTKDFIKGATVKIWKGGAIYKTKASETNPVVIDGICSGGYGVSIVHEHYQTQEFQFEVNCNQTIEFEKLLAKKENADTCCHGKLKVWLKDENGELINNVKVRLWKNSTMIQYKLTENGYAYFDGICKGKYGVDIISEHYKSQEFAAEFDCNESKEITKTLVKLSDTCHTAILKIIAKDFDSKTPIVGAKVYIKLNGQIIADGYTNNDGFFGKEGLTAPQTYTILVVKDGYNDVEFNMTLKECKAYQESANMKSK